ncbi:hypothetical protein BDZ97DRAFT_1965316 [Flammula alnicola]|nr:hypothetical protein BDZ97DRAFT_1965316 [Flammula alnicola]
MSTYYSRPTSRGVVSRAQVFKQREPTYVFPDSCFREPTAEEKADYAMAIELQRTEFAALMKVEAQLTALLLDSVDALLSPFVPEPEDIDTRSEELTKFWASWERRVSQPRPSCLTIEDIFFETLSRYSSSPSLSDATIPFLGPDDRFVSPNPATAFSPAEVQGDDICDRLDPGLLAGFEAVSQEPMSPPRKTLSAIQNSPSARDQRTYFPLKRSPSSPRARRYIQGDQENSEPGKVKKGRRPRKTAAHPYLPHGNTKRTNNVEQPSRWRTADECAQISAPYVVCQLLKSDGSTCGEIVHSYFDLSDHLVEADGHNISRNKTRTAVRYCTWPGCENVQQKEGSLHRHVLTHCCQFMCPVRECIKSNSGEITFFSRRDTLHGHLKDCSKMGDTPPNLEDFAVLI